MKDLSLHILDIVQNSMRAEATKIEISIDENRENDTFSMIIKDNGKGIDKELIGMVTDPFFSTRKTRKIGLGLPLLKQNAEQCAGSLNIISEKGKGTTVETVFRNSHIDRPPLGDIAVTIKILLCSASALHLKYRHCVDGREYALDSSEILEILEDLDVNTPKILNFIKEMVEENLKNIGVIF